MIRSFWPFQKQIKRPEIRASATPASVRLSERVLPKALFLHIQKTGGSSIVEILRRHYGESITSHGECWVGAPDDFMDVSFVSGHFGHHYARSLLQDRYSFVFLRDPIDRILSMYYFCRVQDPNAFDIYAAASSMELKEFLRAGFGNYLVRKNIWNNQVWQLAHGYAHLDDRTIQDFSEDELIDLAFEHLQDFSYIGLTETFDMDRRQILGDLQLQDDMVEMVTNKTPDRRYISDLDEEEIALLMRLTELDRKLYDFVRSRR